MRRTIRLIVLAGALLWALALPVGSAVAAGSTSAGSSSSAAVSSTPATGGNPFALSTPGNQGVTLQPTTPVTTTAASSGGGFNGLDALIIGFVAVLLIVGVGFYVWFDARQHVPRDSGDDYDYFDSPRKGSKPTKKSRKLSAAERKRRKRGRAK